MVLNINSIYSNIALLFMSIIFNLIWNMHKSINIKQSSKLSIKRSNNKICFSNVIIQKYKNSYIF